MSLQIRPLSNQDFFAVVDMLSNLSAGAGKEIAGLISSKKPAKEAQSGELTDVEKKRREEEHEKETILTGLLVIQTCYKHAKDDLIKWFASLCNKSVKEYLALPPETTIEIMEYLSEAQEAKGFFTRAWRLFKKMKSLGNQSTEKSS